MTKSVDALKRELGTLRTGRASPTLVERLSVEYYGTPTPLQQLATIHAPEPRLLVIQPYDKGSFGAIEKAIQKSDLGINPTNDGQVIRLVLPQLTQDRRKELVKVAHQYAEKARVAVRNVRRDGMDQLKTLEKGHHISEDEHRTKSDEVQKMTDETIKEIDAALKVKEAEIMQV